MSTDHIADTELEKSTTVRHWPSIGAFSADLGQRFNECKVSGNFASYKSKTLPDYAHPDKDKRSDWAGGMSARESVAACVNGGGEAFTSKALSVYASIDADNLLTQGPTLWEAQPVGVVPLVPAAITGLPMAMLSRSMVTAGQNEPVRIVFNRMASSYMTPELLNKIGAAVLALANTLSRIRPVELTVMFACGAYATPKHAYIYTVDLGTAPWDMPSLAFALAHPSMLRRAFFSMHGLCEFQNDSIPWPWGKYDSPDVMNSRIRRVLGMGADDILLGGARMDDADLIERDPRAWVEQMLKRFIETRDDE